MTRRIEVPHLDKKVLSLGGLHDLGRTTHAICMAIGFPYKTLDEGIKGHKDYDTKGLTPTSLKRLAHALGFAWTWIEFYDREEEGRDTLEAFIAKYKQDGWTPPSLKPRLETRRPAPVQRVNPLLASVTLYADQDDVAQLGVEVTGRAAVITVPDAHGQPLFQGEIVVLRCQLDFDLGGAQVVGDVTALQKVVAAYLDRTHLEHVFISAGGSAVEPSLVLQVKSGALGVIRPEISDSAADDIDGEHGSLCSLTGLKDGTQISVSLRIYSKELFARSPENSASSATDRGEHPTPSIAGDNEIEPAAIERSDGRPLAVDARRLVMKRLWELAMAAKPGLADPAKPGTIILALDALRYEERR